MNDNKYFDVFMKSGSVYDYLRYRGFAPDSGAFFNGEDSRAGYNRGTDNTGTEYRRGGQSSDRAD